jgi:hypothetical protein
MPSLRRNTVVLAGRLPQPGDGLEQLEPDRVAFGRPAGQVGQQDTEGRSPPSAITSSGPL